MNLFKRYLPLVLMVFLHGCAFVSIPLYQTTQPLVEKTVQGAGRNRIVIVDVSGIITSEKTRGFAGLSDEIDQVSSIKEQLDRAAKDKRVRALILRINSPGGTTTASDIIHREVRRFQQKTNAPVVACMLDLATSGAYYIACASNHIIAHPTTVTGSIGVIVLKFNISGLMSKLGIEEESIKSGSKKDSMSPFRGLTDEERVVMQDIVDGLHENFVQVVARGRPELAAPDIIPLADGQVFTAAQAKAHKLIDSIGYLDDAVALAKKASGIQKARVVMYARPRTYKNNIYSQASIHILGISGTALNEQLPVRFFYLWHP